MPLDPKVQSFLDQMATEMAAADPTSPPIDQMAPVAVRDMFNGGDSGPDDVCPFGSGQSAARRLFDVG